jgi:uncharacterized membrane protein
MEMMLFGLVLFLGTHSISIVNAPWRDRVAARLGEFSWQAIYAVFAVTGFILIIWGYGLARQTPEVLYIPPVWLRHVALLLMLFVFPLLLATYLPGRIKSVTRHPMLLATKIWALAHLLANGMLHDVVLFGAFLAWAVVDRISIKRRAQRPVPGAPASRYNDVIAVVGGLGLYVWFVLQGHAWLFGVSPAG